MLLGKHIRAKNTLFPAISFLLSGMMFYSWATFDGIPARTELRSASGQVSWVRNEKYGVKFGLDGVSKSFNYASKGRAKGLVYDTLTLSDRPVITVLYDPSNPSGPIYSSDIYFSVFELSVAGKPFRSHGEIAEAWRADEHVAVWLGSLFALGGMCLAWPAFRNRRFGRYDQSEA